MPKNPASRVARLTAVVRFSRAWILAALAAGLVACAPHRSGHPAPVVSAPASSVVATTAPAKPPVARPPASSTAEAPTYAQDADKARATLAKKSGEGLTPDKVGYYMDVLQARLRQAVAPQVQISRKQASIVMSLSGGCEVGSGRMQPDAASRDVFGASAGVLKEYRKTLVTVLAHDADAGTVASDPQLLHRCALATALQLSAAGLNAKHIVVPGASTAATSSPEAGSAQRVRYELTIDPIAESASESQ